MSTYQNVVMGLLVVALLPAVYAISRGWMQTPEPKVQRRGAIAMLISVIGAGIALLAGGIGQLIEGRFVLAAASGLCVALLVLSGFISRVHIRAAQHLVATGERLEFTPAEERAQRIRLRVMLGMIAVILVLFVIGLVTSFMGAR